MKEQDTLEVLMHRSLADWLGKCVASKRDAGEEAVHTDEIEVWLTTWIDVMHTTVSVIAEAEAHRLSTDVPVFDTKQEAIDSPDGTGL